MYSACNPNPCNNGGTCADSDDNGVPECTCAAGFFGDTCDIPAGKDCHTRLMLLIYNFNSIIIFYFRIMIAIFS